MSARGKKRSRDSDIENGDSPGSPTVPGKKEKVTRGKDILYKNIISIKYTTPVSNN